ncbi:MAG TPA: hypothetical protein VMU05_14210 [Dongiaceae bacterium]|nr:hypothetical protein [Dongiaceae bacterium]
MPEFLFELLAAILEPFLEAILELVAGAILDVVSRLVSGAFEALDEAPPFAAAFIYGVLGTFAGGCSLLIFPRHLVHPSRVPGISVVLSPLLAGAAFSTLGGFLRSRKKETTGIESFRHGYAFAFGMSVVRLLFAR